jgi:hypothetical protein
MRIYTPQSYAVKQCNQHNCHAADRPVMASRTPNGIADVRVQNRLRLENDPAFQKLSPDSKDLARNVLISADRDGASSVPLLTLLADPSFQKTGDPAKYRMLERNGNAHDAQGSVIANSLPAS